MQLYDLLELIKGPERVRIFRGGKEIFTGYHGMIGHVLEDRHGNGDLQKALEENPDVIDFRASTEIRAKDWKERGLMAPIEPDQAPEYEFKDMILQTYYEIKLE